MKNVLFFAVFLTLFLASCSNQEQTQDSSNVAPVADNVVVINDDSSSLVSSKTNLKNGIYKIKFSGTIPELEHGDIIIGSEGKGFLRKVESFSQDEDILTIHTSQATLDDVFNDASITFNKETLEKYKRQDQNRSITINYLRDGVTISEDDPYTFDFSNTTIYSNDNLLVTIPEGNVSFTPDYYFDADYKFFTGLNSLDFNTDNTEVTVNCNLNIKAFAGETYSYEESLIEYTETFVIPVAGIPITISVETKVVAVSSGSIEASVELDSDFTLINDIDATVSFDKENGWSSDFVINPDYRVNYVNFNDRISATQRLSIKPYIKMDFVGLVGPYAEAEAFEEANLNYTPTTSNWDAEIYGGATGAVGVDLSIFSYVYDSYELSESYIDSIWSAPVGLTNNQDGTVTAVDSYDNPLPGVAVYFQGGANDKVFTNEDGIATIEDGAYLATIYKADGSVISSVKVGSK